jgi:predicted nucleotidyltransferase
MDKEIIKIAQLYAKKVTSYLPVKMVILYGSYVTGGAKKDSDIDIAVVVDKFRGDYLKTSAELFNLVRTINKHIEPVLLVCNHDAGGFLDRILKNGKIIYKSAN